jgi:signal transduction histidine kinase
MKKVSRIRRSLFFRIVGGNAVVAVLIAGAFVLLVRAIGHEREASERADRASAATATAIGFGLQLYDLDSAERSFVVTGKERFLGPYYRARLLYPVMLARLEGQLDGQPADQAQVRMVRRGADHYVRGFLDPLIVAARRDLKAAQRITAGGEAERRSGALRERVFDVFQSQQSKVQAANATASHEAHLAVTIGIIGLVGSFLLLGGFGYLLARGVLRPVGRIARAAEKIARGDRSARVRGSDANGDELQRMAQSFNWMAASVERNHNAMLEAERVKQDFFTLVSHELRTPLTSIIGYLDVLLDDVKEQLPPDQRHKFLAVMDRNSHRLLRLVGDLLFAARVDAGQVELESSEFDLTEVIRESVQTFRASAAREGLQLRHEIAEVPACVGDSGRIAQAVDNLIGNAIKFTPPEGSVTVRLRPGAGDTADIEVEDTGIGIAPDDRHGVFHRFYRGEEATTRAIEGTGLGLAIVKVIVEAHGGNVSFSSVEGEGTVFRISLPIKLLAGTGFSPQAA